MSERRPAPKMPTLSAEGQRIVKANAVRPDPPPLVSVAPPRVSGGTETTETTETRAARPVVRRATDLRPGPPTRWLARHLLPRGDVAVLVGDEGIGKSLWWVLVVAHITTGLPSRLLGLPARAPESVLLILTEDRWADVESRLTAAGADLGMVHVLSEDDDGTGSPVFPRDMPQVREAALALGVGLVVVDAWLDTVHHSQLVRDPQQSRQALHPWSETAARTGACVLLLGHSNRADTANVRDLVGSTAALRQKARVLLYAAAPPDERGQVLYLGADKVNSGPDSAAVAYRIDVAQVRAETDEDPGTVARLSVTGATGAPMRSHLLTWRQEQRDAERPPSADDRAWEWLSAYLTERGGSWPAAASQMDGKAAGHNTERLPRVLREHGGHVGPDGKGGPWVYRLPVSVDSVVSVAPNTPPPATETTDAAEPGRAR